MTADGHLIYLVHTVNFLPLYQLNKILASINWSYYQKLYSEPSGHKPLTAAGTVHHCIQYGVLRLVMQLTQSSRHLRKIPLRMASSWTRQIAELEMRQGFHYGDIDLSEARRAVSMSNLYVCALKILVHKTTHPKSCSSDPYIRQLVLHARNVMLNSPLYPRITTALFWPMIVLLCALRTDDEFKAFIAIPFSFNGGLKRYWQVTIDTVHQARSADPCTLSLNCDISHDGLDLLLLTDGILSNLPNFHYESNPPVQSGVTWSWQGKGGLQV